MMQWNKLLSHKRYSVDAELPTAGGRSPWLVDLDRIAFTSAFRRLQGKTQVHPLDQTAQVRTRLTHSLEVASVGRSIGYALGLEIVPKENLHEQQISAHDFGYIVQAACLAHDIGNPPFGHAGEAAIGLFFEENSHWVFNEHMPAELQDNLKNFEGNAQGFRILNRLSSWRNNGGLRLTYSTLGSFCKYPRAAILQDVDVSSFIGSKKCGIYHSEKDLWLDIAKELGLLQQVDGVDLWMRHPFAFLVEAADDICYSIADIEDAVMLDIIPLEAAEDLLAPIVRHPEKYGDKREGHHLRAEHWYQSMSQLERLDFIRGKAIGNLINATTVAFLQHEQAILQGTFNKEILSETPFGESVKACKKYAYEYVFSKPKKLELETASFDILGGLLDAFCKAVVDLDEHGEKGISPRTQHMLRIIEPKFQFHNRGDALLHICDFIASMTDQHAVNLYRKIRGISI